MAKRKKVSSFLTEFYVPAIALLFFFLLQAGGGLTELQLTFFVAGVSSLLFYWQYRFQEVQLFAIGTGVGLFIEIGFRILGYQQEWIDASLFGIPYWLPIAWGMGFVLITRLGIFIRGIPFKG